ncbi:hypothetical protein GCM10009634_28020 [Saccharothrix xinjiangensis]
MTRVVAALIALVLVAVFAPAPVGPTALARAVPVGHGAPVPTEEECPREQRQALESRSWSPRFAPARNMKRPSCRAGEPITRRSRAGGSPRPDRGRAEHLRTWTRPAALQVFRN